MTTDANGYYRFDRLPAGDYIVEVIAANFAVGQPLQSVGSSNVTEANPNADVDNTDNGIDALPAVAVRSGTVTLGPVIRNRLPSRMFRWQVRLPLKVRLMRGRI